MDTLNYETLPWQASDALYTLDKTLVGQPAYLGIVYFWHTEYKHEMRSMSFYGRRKVHAAFLKAKLELAEFSDAHRKIIDKFKRHIKYL